MSEPSKTVEAGYLNPGGAAGGASAHDRKLSGMNPSFTVSPVNRTYATMSYSEKEYLNIP